MHKLLLILTGSVLLGACTTVAPPPTSGIANPDEQPVHEYRIGVDDVVSVNVWQNPGLSVQVPVRPDGKISMPLLGDVQAGGLTAQQVSENIEKQLSRYVKDPHVVVILTDLKSHAFLSRVRVTGAVNNPVTLPYRRGMTVLDAILEAGGLTEFASANRTVLYRRNGKTTESIPVHLEDVMKRGDLSTNYALGPGDVIAVPERFF
ncbi:MAG: polysaccharide biosynthesis/export family protein [Gammaproteobacteria bacterium]|jgi:polysaccharide export outer membrane protein